MLDALDNLVETSDGQELALEKLELDSAAAKKAFAEAQVRQMLAFKFLSWIIHLFSYFAVVESKILGRMKRKYNVTVKC